MKTFKVSHQGTPPHDGTYQNTALDELRAIRAAIEALSNRFDQFVGVFLNARFPFGKPTDRWRRG